MMGTNGAGVRSRNDLPSEAVQLRSRESGSRRVKVEQPRFRPTVDECKLRSINCASTPEVDNETNSCAGEWLKE